jgi:transaldolase
MTDHLKELSALRGSIWLDDLSRPLIAGGGLQALIDTSSVVGVTTNPTLFAAALSHGDIYRDQITALATQGKSVDEAVFALGR